MPAFRSGEGSTRMHHLKSILTDLTGTARTNRKQWERIEIHLPRFVAADHIACFMVNSKCTALPVGASLDRKNSILYWQVPNAYLGVLRTNLETPFGGTYSRPV